MIAPGCEHVFVLQQRGLGGAVERRDAGAATGARLPGVAAPSLIEFPADDPERARRFWEGFLGRELAARGPDEGEGWQSRGEAVAVGVHARGPGPGDTVSLPYFAVDDLDGALARVTELGGSVVHAGGRWAICRDSEGSPFGLGPLGS